MSLERNFETQAQSATTARNAPDMQAIAHLGSLNFGAPSNNHLDQMLAGDKFPQLGLSNDSHMEKNAANNAQHPLQKMMQHLVTHAQKIHAAIGVDMSKTKDASQSGCPAAGMRAAFGAGGGANKPQ